MEKLTLSGNRGKNPNAGNCCLFLVGIKKNALPAQRISNYIFKPFFNCIPAANRTGKTVPDL